jgi:hypothetical protein
MLMAGSFNAVAFYLSIAGELAGSGCVYECMLMIGVDMLAKENL